MCSTDATTVTIVRTRMTVLARAVPLAAKWKPTSTKSSRACTGAAYLATTQVRCSMTPQMSTRMTAISRNSAVSVSCYTPLSVCVCRAAERKMHVTKLSETDANTISTNVRPELPMATIEKLSAKVST